MAHVNVPEPRREDLEAEAGEPADPEWAEEGAMYLTLTVSKAASLAALPDRTIFWAADTESVREQLEGFTKEAQSALDHAAARLHGQDLQGLRIVHRDGGAYFEPCDVEYARLRLARLTGSARGYVTRPGWADFDDAPITSMLDDLWAKRQDDVVLESPSWWYYQASLETDPLRRFLFSFWGLEVLATKYTKEHRDDLTAMYSSLKPGAPIKSLIWPTPQDNDRPGRSAEFAFAVMAALLGGEQAEVDVGAYKSLAAQRNKVSHGKRLDLSALPRHEGLDLLGKYLGLVNNASCGPLA